MSAAPGPGAGTEDHAGPEVLCLGEALVDLYALPAGRSFATAESFVRHSGGAPANVATCIARLGGRTQLCTRIGDDDPGAFLAATLGAEGVDTSRLRVTAGASTGLCFVISEGAARRFLRYPRGVPAADKTVTLADLEGLPLATAPVVYAGSTGLAREPSRQSWLEALRRASPAGGVLVDVNLRLHQWEDTELAVRCTRQLVGMASAVKAAHDELEPLLGTADPVRAAEALRALGPALALVTLGADGAFVLAPGLSLHLPAPEVVALDVTGAGDGFAGVVALALARLQAFTGTRGIAAALARAPAGWLPAVVALANQVGARAATGIGATAALPRLPDLGEAAWPLLRPVP